MSDLWAFGDEIADDLRAWITEAREHQMALLVDPGNKEIALRAMNHVEEVLLNRIALAQHQAEEREREAEVRGDAEREGRARVCGCTHG